VRSISVPGVEGMEAASEKERVLYEAVVEVVVDELSQLGIHR
jgi:hypothetical protein